MLKSIINKYWWILLLFSFDFAYFYFIKHITTPKTDGLWVAINLDGLLFVFLVSLLSLGCVLWVKGRMDKFVTLSIPIKYLQILFFSFVLFLLLTTGFQVSVEYAAGNRRNLEYVISNGLTFTFLHLIVSNAYVAIAFFRESNALKQDLLRAEKAKVESELRVLQQQMDPHFLFNNLNTLASLIPQDSDKAVAFTQGLSQIFRYVSQNGKRDVATLSEELSFIDQYMGLLNFRFGTAYQLCKQLDNLPVDQVLIVPLSLQLLIENVVKHNSGSRSNPLILSITVEDHHIVISNEIRKKALSEEMDSGIGLENLQERYQLRFGQNVDYETKDGYFIVRLPIIKSVEDDSTDY